MIKRWLYPIILLLILAGCAPLETPTSTPVEAVTPLPYTAEPTPIPFEPTASAPQPTGETPPPGSQEAVLAARRFLAQQLGLELGDIQLLQVRAVEWPDACLGIPVQEEMCAEVITPGFVIDLVAVVDGASEYFTFHTDASGEVLRVLPAAVLAARQALSEQTGLLPEEITLLSIEYVEWRNSCLGVTTPGLNCLEVITPGYRIILSAAGMSYEYHTNQDGSHLVLASGAENFSPPALLVWSRLTEPCTTVEMDLQEVRAAPCGAAPSRIGAFPLWRAAELEHFTAVYAPLAGETAAGIVALRGAGQVRATPAEMRMLAEWAKLVYDEAVSGRSSAAWSLAFSWHREGGIAGFCDDIGVYLTGESIVTSCQGSSLPELGRPRLDSAQLSELYAWVDNLAPFEIKLTDPATADAMTTHLVFAGQGTDAVSANQQSGMIHLANELLLQAQTPPDPQAQAAAELALNSYLAALSAGDYAGAAALYGGSYGLLIDNNPSRDPADHASLFEGACTINGHVCNLSVRNIVHVAGLAPGIYRFTVELAYLDGTLFELFGCCTDTPLDPPKTQFAFQVELVDGHYLVMTLPVYAG
jgi:hypothetical protein